MTSPSENAQVFDMNVIHITEKAAQQVFSVQKNDENAGQYLRVSVVGGGCSGMSYKLTFDHDMKDKDKQFQKAGMTLLVDPKSFLFLKGTTLDFTDGLNGQGFVFQNPNAKQTCGCGSSFSA